MAEKTIRELRIKARKLGVTNARELSKDELEDAIAEARNGSSTKTKSKKAVKKAVKGKVIKRGPGRPRKDEDEDEPVKKKRGRPAGSGKKVKATEEAPKKRGRPSTKKTASKSSNGKANPVGRPPGSGTGTRVLVPDRIKFNRDFDFREGTTSAYILNQLRKSAKRYTDTDDIREDTMEKLEVKLNKIDELTFNNRATGKPHKGESALKMLRYRVNRTILDYCIETDQHDGLGNGSTTTKKKSTKTEVKRGRGRPKKVIDDDDEDEDEDEDEPVKKKRGRPPGTAKKKRGRPPGSKSKTTEAEKPRRGRPPGKKNKVKATVSGKKRGRPKGSKNRN